MGEHANLLKQALQFLRAPSRGGAVRHDNATLVPDADPILAAINMPLGKIRRRSSSIVVQETPKSGGDLLHKVVRPEIRVGI